LKYERGLDNNVILLKSVISTACFQTWPWEYCTIYIYPKIAMQLLKYNREARDCCLYCILEIP
jgi:hypothetical protein